jgi:hypothetical protein
VRRPNLGTFPNQSGDDDDGIDWVEQLRRLVDLYDRGLVSSEQVRRQQERMLQQGRP